MLALQESRSAALVIENGRRQGHRVALGGTLRVGRHPYNDLSLDDPAASRYHCWVYMSDAGPVLEDLASSNGTFVNGARVSGKRVLQPGDVIRVGTTRFTIRAEG